VNLVQHAEYKASRGSSALRTDWFDLGPVAVSVTCELPEVADEFADLYSDIRIAVPRSRHVLQMTVRAIGTSRWRRTRYAVLGDGVELFTDLAPAEVLPYLEWGINHRFIATCDEFLIFHAAGLARDGHGLMLVGASGSGKSTLAAAMAARGWQYLGDEFALLDPGTLRLHPYRKAVCVKSGSFELMRRLGLPLVHRDSYAKSFKGPLGFVPARALPAPAGPVPVRTVVFPHYGGGWAAGVHDLPPARAAFLLAESAFNPDSVGAALPTLLGRLATECDCFALSTGDLDAAVTTLESCWGAVSAGPATP
jgi:HprK-related kinase A